MEQNLATTLRQDLDVTGANVAKHIDPPFFVYLTKRQRQFWDHLILSKWWQLWTAADLIMLSQVCRLLEQIEYYAQARS